MIWSGRFSAHRPVRTSAFVSVTMAPVCQKKVDRPRLRAIFYDQASRRGLGTRTRHCLRHRPADRRIHQDFTPTKGWGTTITVLLPIDPNHVKPSEHEQSAGKVTPPIGTETVLVVDDEAGLREVTRRILTRGGYSVITASSGAEALELAASHEGPNRLAADRCRHAEHAGPGRRQ